MYMPTPKTDVKPLPWRKNFSGHWRKYAGFSQETVAEILEREELIDSHASVSRIENGKQRPSIVTIEAMARLYGTDIDSLLNRPPPERRRAAVQPEPKTGRGAAVQKRARR